MGAFINIFTVMNMEQILEYAGYDSYSGLMQPVYTLFVYKEEILKCAG